MALKPRIKAICPVCSRPLECDVAFANANSDVEYTIVVSQRGYDHIKSHD